MWDWTVCPSRSAPTSNQCPSDVATRAVDPAGSAWARTGGGPPTSRGVCGPVSPPRDESRRAPDRQPRSPRPCASDDHGLARPRRVASRTAHAQWLRYRGDVPHRPVRGRRVERAPVASPTRIAPTAAEDRRAHDNSASREPDRCAGHDYSNRELFCGPTGGCTTLDPRSSRTPRRSLRPR